MGAEADPPGDPTTWPCPPWRHMRYVAVTESRALRAFARLQLVPVLPAPDLLDDYRPRTDWRRLGIGNVDTTRCGFCGETINRRSPKGRAPRFCGRDCQVKDYNQRRTD